MSRIILETDATELVRSLTFWTLIKAWMVASSGKLEISLAYHSITMIFGTVRGIATKWQIALQCMGQAWLAQVQLYS
jgi:hypothetical protein